MAGLFNIFKFIYMKMVLFALLLCACNNTAAPETQSRNDTAAALPAAAKTKAIVFFGNSLTAGYGINAGEAFPALIQQKIDSAHLPYTVVNSGVSGETSSGGASRIDWVLRQPLDVFVLELGANDGLRGLPLSETVKSLQAIIDHVKTKYPDAKILLAGMQLPPNMGQTYTTAFRAVYPALAQKNGAALIPFLLEGVGGDAKLNQDDGIHPTAEGHKVVAQNVWQNLEPLL